MNPSVEKKCTSCGLIKRLDQFHKKADRKGGLDSRCKNCKNAAKLGYLRRKGVYVNQNRFNSVVNGLNSISKKVFDVVPIDTCWGSARIQSELFRTGSSQTRSIIEGSLKALVGYGLIQESQPGLFRRVKVTNKKQDELATEKQVQALKQTQPKETIMAIQAQKTNQENPFDAVREVAIKFMDAAKTINTLASEIDNKLNDVEKFMAANGEEIAKLKQLQSLLKSLG